MKTRYLKSILTLFMVWIVMPVMGQDCMEVFFKDGSSQKFYLEGVSMIETSKFDENGAMHSEYLYQHISTRSKKYVYCINDIDYISFTKYNEEEVKQDFYTAISETLPILYDCETIDDAEQKIDVIKNIEGVADAWSDGHQLYIKIKNWETISFHFNHDDDDASLSLQSTVNQIRSLATQIRENVVGNSDKKPSLVVANQQHKDKSRTSQITLLKSLVKDFNDYGFNAVYEDNPTLEFFAKGMYDYDIVFLLTHGGYFNKLHSFVTSEDLGQEVWSICDDEENPDNKPSKKTTDKWCNALLDLIKETKYEGTSYIKMSYVRENRESSCPSWVAHPSIKEDFFGTKGNGGLSEGKFSNNSIFFNIACQSMDGNDQNPEAWHSMADKLIDNHGLGLYFGYKGSNYRGNRAGTNLLRSLLKGLSVGYAYYNLDKNLKVEYDKKEHAELKCYPEIGKGDLFLVPTYTEAIDPAIIAESDFKNHQYVEVKGSTTTSDMNAITIGFQYNTYENFTSGTDVTIVEKNPLAQPTDKGNLLFKAKLKDLVPGKTYYYRAYTSDGRNYNYGDTYSFTISNSHPSCPDDNHPHLIDLDLPSGTKWACCNVGASKPEEYGNYYAWGESRPKSVYDWDTYQYSLDDSHLVDIGSDIAGTGYDAATNNWGTPWRMPSKMQCDELINYTTFVMTTQNGVYGAKFIGSNGHSIFLPAAGRCYDKYQKSVGSAGFYWTSTRDKLYWWCSIYLFLPSGGADADHQLHQTNGLSVRPVRKN